MANTLISSATNSCAYNSGVAGKGLVTTWTLRGETVAYSGTLSTTDGYNITASFIWQTLATNDNTIAGKDCATYTCAIGTCVETLDSNGDVIGSHVVDEGNMALCHWFHLAVAASSTTYNTVGVNSSSTTAYTEVRYL